MAKIDDLSKKYNFNKTKLELFADYKIKQKYFEFIIKNKKEIISNKKYNFDFKYPTTLDVVDGIKNLKNLFDKFEKSSSKLYKKDIYQYSFDELLETLEKISKSASEIKKEGVRKIYEDDNILIVHPVTYKANKLYSANTKWCTSNPYYYKQYNYLKISGKSYSYSFLIILIDKIKNKKYAINIKGSADTCNEIDKFNFKNNKFYLLTDSNSEIMSFIGSEFNNYLNNVIKNNNHAMNFYFAGSLSYIRDYMLNIIKHYMFLSSEGKLNCSPCYFNISNILLRKDFEPHILADFFIKNTLPSKLNLSRLIKSFHNSKCPVVTTKKAKMPVVKCKRKTQNVFSQETSPASQSVESLKRCSCSSFNEFKLLNVIKNYIEINSLNDDELLSVINQKLKSFEILSQPKIKIIDKLLLKDYNNLPIISNISLARDEALFLQVYSNDDKVKSFCKKQFNIADDLAKEILDLKNIKSLNDLI